MHPNRRYSDMWNYFTVYKPGKALCNSCRQKISYKSTISNLKAHLSRIHPEIVVKTRTTKERHAFVELVDMGHFEANDAHQKERSPSVNNDCSNELCPSTSSSEEEALLKSVNRLKKKSKKARPIKIKHEMDTSDGKCTGANHRNTRRKNKNVTVNTTPEQTEKVDAYALSMSLRLEQMQSNQRFIAEKLISDVIFYGRFGKLSEEAKVTCPTPVINAHDHTSPEKQSVYLKYNGRTMVMQNEHDIVDSSRGNETNFNATDSKVCYEIVET